MDGAPGSSELTIEDETLEPGELPGWLQAIQPAKAAFLGQEDFDLSSKIETSGPLAGYQGVLPGHTTPHYSAPTSTSILQITEKQRVYADMLESIIHQESIPQAIPGAKKTASPFIIRLLIGAALFALVGFLLVNGNTPLSPYPGLFPVETGTVF